jgi:hypothetical protein
MTKTIKKFKHNYTSELELKSLLIRIKNNRNEDKVFSTKDNSKINKYLRYHTNLNNLKNSDTVDTLKKNTLKKKIKQKIIKLSENTKIDTHSFERFGEIILLMVTNILKKPQFSGYTYQDDFYSDAVYKILKYLGNFNHNLISERSGLKVNAFAYISQIIHNSIIYIIKTKNSHAEKHKNYATLEYISKMRVTNNDWYVNNSLIDPDLFKLKKEIQETVTLNTIDISLVQELILLKDDIEKSSSLIVYYPNDYRISFEEYNELKPLLQGKVSIIRTGDELKSGKNNEHD